MRLPGLGHFKDEATFNLMEGDLKDVHIKQVASSADCCLALSGNTSTISTIYLTNSFHVAVCLFSN